MSHREASIATRGHGTKRRILLAAARVLAAREAASMADIAAAAEITRGTLYRHFPARESLIKALEAAANEEAGRRLVTVGEDFIVLLRERRPPEPGFTAPLEALLERGREGGQIRTDVPLATLVESLLVLVGACVRTGKPAAMGVEDMSSTALRLFLTGSRPAAE